MNPTVKELAYLVGGKVVGDGNLEISDASTLRDVAETEITFVDSERLLEEANQCAAAAMVTSHEIVGLEKTCILVDDVRAAFAEIVAHFRPPRTAKKTGVHPKSHIADTANLGENVQIHPFVSIGEDVVIGDNTTIHANTTIMDGCRIGSNVTLFPGVVVYENNVIGDDCIIHAGVIIGAYGFGYESSTGTHVLSAQLGNVKIEDQVEIGANSTIDRGTYNSTVIGTGTKLDNLVMVGHNVSLGKHMLLCGQSGVAGSTKIGDYAILGGQVGVADHVTICDHVVLGAQSGLTTDVDAPGVYSGTPVTPVRDFFTQVAALKKLPELRRAFKKLQQEVAELAEPANQKKAA